jgi:uncharacterized pyridoxal phosphate-dependent enzyme
MGGQRAWPSQESSAMSSYAELGLRPIINASATLTRLGGSIMPPPVVAAMAAAAGSFVDLALLQERAGARIAALTNNDACFISCGAAAGIVLSVAACIAGEEPQAIASFPHALGPRDEVIVHRCQRNGYDYAIRQTGARLVEIGGDSGTQRADLERAIGARTACVVYFAGAHYERGALPLADVIATAHTHGIPVIVDAAAQIPPIASLWQFTRDMGADLAVFSGGKGLRGPQSAGLVLGRADLVRACQLNGSPNTSIGRPMKVSKEELIGMLAAVEWSLAQDEPALIAQYEQIVQYWLAEARDIPGIRAERGFPSEAGQPHARAILHIEPSLGMTRDELAAALLAGDPAVAVGTAGAGTIALNPQTIIPGEERLVIAALRQALARVAG